MKVCVLLSQGYEEVEALSVVDYLRRAGISVDMLATQGDINTIGDHDIQIKADYLLKDINPDDYDVIVTPGGMPGTMALCDNASALEMIKNHFDKNKLIASICASPMVLESAGIASQIKGTVFPGLENKVNYKEHIDQIVVYDENANVITSQGPATAVYFAMKIIEVLNGKDVMQEVADGLLLGKVEDSITA